MSNPVTEFKELVDDFEKEVGDFKDNVGSLQNNISGISDKAFDKMHQSFGWFQASLRRNRRYH